MKTLPILSAIFSAIAFMPAVGMAAPRNNHFCLNSIPSQSPTRSVYMLSYSDLQNGHMVLSGEVCYSFPPYDQVDPASHDCFPVVGSGILFEDRIEINVQSSEFTRESGADVLFSGVAHLWLDSTNFTGEYNRHGDAWMGGELVEYAEQGTIVPIKCPVRKGERRLDRKFERIIKNFDKRF